MGVINFVEQQRSALNLDYLVYICGVDVSPYIADLTVHYTDRGAPGSVDLVLTNPFDQWILTTQNFKGSFRNTSDRYSETPKQAIYLAKKTLSKKVQIKGRSSGIAGASGNAEEDFLQRYAFGPGSCVFSRFDTVRIFMRNPYDPDALDRWFPMFTGTVENKPVTSEYINGASSVHLSCYDIRATLSGMRVATNPYTAATWQQTGSTGTVIVFDEDSAGFYFKDFLPTNQGLPGSGTSNIFSGKSFVDAVSMITTGRIGWVNERTFYNGTLGTQAGQGVGNFAPGFVYRYKNPQSTTATDSRANVVTDLEDWDNLCIFGPTQDFLTQAQCQAMGRASFWPVPGVTQGQTYSPLDGKVHFLLPAEGLNITSMIATTFEGIKDIMAAPDWTNRFQLISQICGMVDYQWTVTGNGDIVFEFPMYDFFPENFGANSSIYKVQRHLVSDSIADESGEIFAGVEARVLSTQLGLQQAQQIGQQQAAGTLVPQLFGTATAFSNVLASRFGAKVVSVSFTGVTDEKAIQKLAVIELQKRLSEANKLSMDFSFRPWLRPNRPIQHVEKNRVGRISSVSLSLPALQAPRVSLGVDCVRLPLYKNGQVTYQQIAGGPGMAISYNSIFETPDSITNPISGISTMYESAQKGKTQ